MSYTALQLITKSYYLSQIVSRGLQTVSGEQITDGLSLLNALLDVKGSDIRLIPYFQRYSFAMVNGQEEYYIPNLLSVEAITFNIGDVRFPLQKSSRRQYFGNARVDNITNLPCTWHLERELGGSRLYFYFLPGGTYTCKLSGKFGLTDVTLTTDLSTVYDLYYIEYLRFALAEYICADWGATFPDQAAMKYKEIRKKLMDITPFDLTIQKMSYFNDRPSLDWQQVNLGAGYYPGF